MFNKSFLIASCAIIGAAAPAFAACGPNTSYYLYEKRCNVAWQREYVRSNLDGFYFWRFIPNSEYMNCDDAEVPDPLFGPPRIAGHDALSLARSVTPPISWSIGSPRPGDSAIYGCDAAGQCFQAFTWQDRYEQYSDYTAFIYPKTDNPECLPTQSVNLSSFRDSPPEDDPCDLIRDITIRGMPVQRIRIRVEGCDVQNM